LRRIWLEEEFSGKYAVASSIMFTETNSPPEDRPMRIDGTTGSQTSLGFNPANANRVSTPDNASGDSASAAVQFQPTSDYQSLSGALGRIPQVRQDVIGEVASRLNAGELATPQARQQTVESILGSSPGRD
jgi:hypothetical protein